MPKPSSIYSATPNLTRTRTLLRRLTWVPLPRHRPEAIARRPKTKKLHKWRDFCFCEAPIVATRQIPQRVSRPNGGSCEKRIDVRRQQQAALFEPWPMVFGKLVPQLRSSGEWLASKTRSQVNVCDALYMGLCCYDRFTCTNAQLGLCQAARVLQRRGK